MTHTSAARGLRRIPTSLSAARALVAYQERTLRTSTSVHLHQRAKRRLENLKPVIERLEREEAQRRVPPYRHVYQRRQDPNFDIVWDGT
jgi:hypothetical protein